MRQDIIVRAIGECPFFSGMAQDERAALAQAGHSILHDEGEVIFRPREAPSALYLVLDGVVEICRSEDEDTDVQPVAYLGRGALLGESKIITGTAMGSLARFPEGGATLQWARPIILRKLYQSSDFAMHYLQSLARRLEGAFGQLGARGGTNLGGMLDHFDLPTILQTVVDSDATGVLEVRDAQGNKFGAIHTRGKTIGPMLCGTLSGAEAFLEILVSPPEKGTFRFASVSNPRETEEHFQLRPLLMEAARIQDEFQRFARELPGDTELRISGRRPDWNGEHDRQLVEQIWQILAAQPCGWTALADRLPWSNGQVALAVRDLMCAGFVESEGDHVISAGNIEEFGISF